MEQVGLGGGCHWCTEAVFQTLRGVSKAQQGWIGSQPPHESMSEAVLVEFDSTEISLDVLIQIHLYTHSCTSNHSMRDKYRSAVYIFDDEQFTRASLVIGAAQTDFDKPIITQVLPFSTFQLNDESFLNYYHSNPNKPFCKTHINPKLRLLQKKFAANVNVLLVDK